MEEKLEVGGKNLPANEHIGSEGSKNIILAVVVVMRFMVSTAS